MDLGFGHSDREKRPYLSNGVQEEATGLGNRLSVKNEGERGELNGETKAVACMTEQRETLTDMVRVQEEDGLDGRARSSILAIVNVW